MLKRALFTCAMLMSGLFLSAAETELTIPFHGGTQTFVVADDFVAVPVTQDATAPAAVATGAEQKLEVIQRADLAQRAARAPADQRHEHAVLFARAGKRDQRTATILERSVAVKLAPGTDIADICRQSKSTLTMKVSFADEWYIVMPEAPGALAGVDLQNELQKMPGVECAEVQTRRLVTSFGVGNDPLLKNQYHLAGDGPTDVHASAIWDFSTGKGLGAGILVNVVDNGIETHPDLSGNVLLSLGARYFGGFGPFPVGDHGTFVSGLIAGIGNNSEGGSGVAPKASIIPVGAIGAYIGDSQLSAAMAHRAVVTDGTKPSDISNNSWGSIFDISPMSSLFSAAINKAVTDGRSGRGMVYVFAAGNFSHFYTPAEYTGIRDANGGALGITEYCRNLNYSSANSSRWVIPVGAVDRDAKRGRYAYSQGGAGLMCVAAGGSIDFDSSFRKKFTGIVSLDLVGKDGFGKGDYTTIGEGAAGTSFAAPIVSGVVALMLEANPELTYRDVQHIIARHSLQCDPNDEHLSRVDELPDFRKPDQIRAWSKWQTNHANPALHHSVYYGFGKADAALAVDAARKWVLAPSETSLVSTPGKAFNIVLNADNNSDVSISVPAQGFSVEHVELHVEAKARLAGQTFVLTSPSGSTSYIERQPYSVETDLNFTFTSVAHWGENPAGKWSLKALNDFEDGSISRWSVKVFGHQPYVTPVISSISPKILWRTGTDQTLKINGSGFVRNRPNGIFMTRFRSGSDLLTVASVNASDDSVTVKIPPNLLVGVSSLTVVAENPDFNSQISGTPGTFAPVMYRTSSALTVIIPTAPVISVNPAVIEGHLKEIFNYQIQASAIPTSYGASPLPPGLTINAQTGIIRGRPTTLGSWEVTLTAKNAEGEDSKKITIRILPAIILTIPVITLNTTTVQGRVGEDFDYQINASQTPTKYDALPLPAGLVINTATGKISGKPTLVGSMEVTISASNAKGSATAKITIKIDPSIVLAPVIAVNSSTVKGRVGEDFDYQIQASSTPSSYDASPLPVGLIINTTTGKISGKPTVAGSTEVTLTATNTQGAGSAKLTLTIDPPVVIAPVITVNPSTVLGRIGEDFDYQIQASSTPTSYGASPLPAGLVINANTGKITGKPTTTGSPAVTLTATNSEGTGSAILTINVQPAILGLPVVTSVTSATARVGVPFTYTITATNSATGYVATGLPAGWTFDASSGVISGTPTATGNLVVTIGATNATGDGPTKTLTISVNPALPVITSAPSAAGEVNKSFAYTITATATGALTFGASTLPAGLTVDPMTGVISGTPQVANTTVVTISATDTTGGVGTANVTVVISAAPVPPSSGGGSGGGGGCGLGGGLAIMLACGVALSGVALSGWAQRKARTR